MPIIFYLSENPIVVGALQFFNKINTRLNNNNDDLISGIAGLLAGVISITNAFTDSWGIIYEFKKRTDKILS